MYERRLKISRTKLSDAVVAAAWTIGHAMSLEDAVGYARSPVEEAAAASKAPAAAKDQLTPRQREVAALIAQGLTNRQIGERLVVTEAAAAKHVEHILDKLGIGTRAQIAAWAAERGLVTTWTD
jgi:non-specific serine/threonine protein kinase